MKKPKLPRLAPDYHHLFTGGIAVSTSVGIACALLYILLHQNIFDERDSRLAIRIWFVLMVVLGAVTIGITVLRYRQFRKQNACPRHPVLQTLLLLWEGLCEAAGLLLFFWA